MNSGAMPIELIIFQLQRPKQVRRFPFAAAESLPPFAEVFITRKRCIRDALFDEAVPCVWIDFGEVFVKRKFHNS